MRRIGLLLLSLGWGWLVYGVDQGLGYEKAIGYPSEVKSLGLAFLAALPLLLGGFIADSRTKTRKCLRWLSMLWLVVQAGFLLILSWMKLFGLIPLLGFALLLWQELEGVKPPDKTKKNRSWQVLMLVLLMPCGLLYWWHYNPLPSDEEMIARLQAHRMEIEELVSSYRAWEPSAATPTWHNRSEIEGLMGIAGVRYVTRIGPVWHPDPYSAEAGKRFEDEMSVITRARKVSSINRYSSIDVELKNSKRPRGHFANVLLKTGPALIFKELVYFPEVAKIEGENLWFPANLSYVGKELKEVKGKSRIFPSLNDYPDNWKKGECVYRQIDTHWFIRMCIAAT